MTKPKIYESPDGGLTIFARDFGEPPDTRTIAHMPHTDITFRHDDPIMRAVKENSYFVDAELCGEHPELQAKWEEFKDLQKHYVAWDLLNKK